MIEIERLRYDYNASLVFMSQHASDRCRERGIIQKDIKNCVMTGEIIEQYPEDYPYPSCLVYGMDSKGKPIHVVLCDTGESSKIITAYYPNIEVFKEDLKTRRER